MIGKINAYEYLYKLFKEDIFTSMMSLKMIMEMLETFVMSTPRDTPRYIYIYIYGIMICGYLDDGDSVLADDILIYGRPGL